MLLLVAASFTPSAAFTKMSTIQNLKNFIRHGKQARAADPPRDQPTTNVSPVHAQQQKYHHGISEPAVGHRQPQNHVQPHPGEYSAAAVDNRNVAAQAGAAAANVTGKHQKIQADIEALVAEEREQASKMPKYPGLERYILLEKMGDGAFSNVYKARDTQTGDDVAIKVVRKFEMNSNQVCYKSVGFCQLSLALFLSLPVITRSSPHCALSYHILHTQVFNSCKCAKPTLLSNLGRCSSSSELQEATKGRGGAQIHLIAQPLPLSSGLHFLFFRIHSTPARP